MNYRSILKEFDQSIVAENKKLMETYNRLLKESEDVCPKCGKSPCVCAKEEVTECGDQVQEDDMLKDREHNLHISAKKFFEDEEDVTDEVPPVEDDENKEVPEVIPDETVGDDTETVDEGDDDGNLVSAEEFFGKSDDVPADDSKEEKTDDVPVEAPEDDEKVDEAAKTMTPSGLFEDEEKKEDEQKPVEGDETKTTDNSEDKAEFFAEECNKGEEKKEEPVEKVDETCTEEKKDADKTEEITEEKKDEEAEKKEDDKPVEESKEDAETEETGDEEMTDSEKEMKELKESMDAVKMFVNANKRFFPVNG